jgi:hypothetical protein
MRTSGRPQSVRSSETDPETGVVTTSIFNDAGENRDLAHGLISGSTTRERWSIHPDDPQSATAHIRWEQTGGRDTGAPRTVAEMEMRCDSNWFYLIGTVSDGERHRQVFDRQWSERIARRFV